MSTRPGYGSRRPYAVPEALTDLHGPATGLVELPVAVAWTGRRTYDLEAPADLVVMYERVIVEAPTVEVLGSLIDQERLLSVWVHLYLPQHVRQLWQSRFRADGLEVDIVVDAPSFSRFQVRDALTERSAQVELGMDWRAHPPTILNIGPVLHPDDAVANKVTALFSRAQARDYIDVNGALISGRYSRDDLVRLAEEHDPGFDRRLFAQALTAIERLPDSEFTAYGLDAATIAALRARLTNWANEFHD